MRRIALIEDNPAYAEVAKRAISGNNQTANPTDYNSAVALLRDSVRYDGAIIDCFFPEETGTGKRDKGREAINAIAREDPKEMRGRAYLDAVSAYAELDSVLRSVVKNLGYEIQDPLQDPFVCAIAQVGKVFPGNAGKQVVGLFVRNALREKATQPTDHYADLERALEENEANQPLGILVAVEAQNLAVPFVLATSGHHHDTLTQPVADYTKRKGWTLIDSSPGTDGKATPEFWQKVFRELERKMR